MAKVSSSETVPGAGRGGEGGGETATSPAQGGTARIVDDVAASLVPGEVIARRYRIVRLLGRGGMGEVYEVDDESLDLRVALKTLPAAQRGRRDAVERLGRELVLARRVSHRNVCRVFDLGDDAARGIWFATMELLGGETLADRLARVGRFEAVEARLLLAQLGAGLAAAHAVGVVHRDLKPSNVMLVRDEAGERAVITDFGLARLDDDDRTTATRFAGTPAYMAPEQLTGDRLRPAVDVYALGVVAFELVTGTLPFAGGGALATALARLTESVPRPSAQRPELDRRWDALVSRCLARDAVSRPAAGQVVAILDGTMPRWRPRWSLVAGPALAVGATAAMLAVRVTPAAAPRADHGARVPFAFAIGGVGDDNVNSLAFAADGDLLLGGHVSAGARLDGRPLAAHDAAAHGAYVARTSRLGQVRWTWTAAGTNDVRVVSLARAPDGDVIAVGVYYARVEIAGVTLPDPTGDTDGLILRLDGETGEVRWVHALGASASAHLRAVAVDAAGDIYVAGEYAGAIQFGARAESSGGGASAGRSPLVASFRGDGMPRWIAAGHHAKHARLFGLTIDRGRVIASGMVWAPVEIAGVSIPCRGPGDAVVLALDTATGQRAWHLHLQSGGPPEASASDVMAVAARDGRVVVTGNFQRQLTVGDTSLRTDGPMAAFVAELDPESGAPRWAVGVDGDAFSNPGAIVLRDDGAAIVAGKIRGEGAFGGAAVRAAGDEDALILVVDRDGRPGAVQRIGGKTRERARTLGLADDGALFVGGMYVHDLVVGRHHLPGHGSTDAFVAQIDLAAPDSISPPASAKLEP